MRKTDKKIRCSNGFTLVELLIAMALSLLVMGAVYALYINFIRTSTGQDKLLEVQQEARVAMERVAKEVRAAGCYYRNNPILSAGSSVFEFESDVDPDPNNGPWMINYGLDTVNNELTRSEAAWTGSTYGAYTASQTVAGHVTGLTFTYYDENNAVIATPITSQANRDLIRRVVINLTTQTDQVNPATNKFDSVTLNTSVYLRCMGVQQSTDTTECALPTNIKSTDPNLCGQLNLSWTKSSSSDAAGYKLYYKPTGTAFFSGVIDISGGATESYTITGLTQGQQYDFGFKCYDTSGNENTSFMGSATNVVLSGTSGNSDTKPDDNSAPELPANTDSTAGDGFATLSWSASPSVDVGGYSIYRSDDGGSTYTKIKEVGSTVLSYSDTTVTNCPAQPYYYKVTSWDCADNEKSLSAQSAVYGDAAKVGGISDVPNDGTTDTEPTETTPPSDPTGFNAIAGADKVYLSYTTPADTDLLGVRILRRTDQTPTDENDPLASGPNNPPVSDYDPLSPSQTYGLVDSGGPGGIVLDTTYYYRAFAYDGCMNYSAGSISQATAKPCGDGAVGSKHYGPPSAPASLTPSVCSTASLTWPASTGSENGNTFNPSSEDDVVGYYVYRATTSGGPYSKLNPSAPVTTTSYSDTTVTTGNTYYYVVSAVDCAGNESTIMSPEARVIPTGIDWDNAVNVTTSATSGISGSQHNIVKLGIKNLGNTSVTIDSATISWTTATAYLKKVSLLPFGGTQSDLWNDTVLPLTASGVSIDFSSYQTDPALRRLAALSLLNELTLEFRESDDGGFVDMRGATITVTLNYTNDDAGTACSSSTFSVPVPLGPVISNSIQNAPTDPTTSNLSAGSVVVATGSQDTTTYVWTPQTVTVTATITPESSTTISSTKLYYTTTDRSTSTAPSTDYSSSPSGWTALTMCGVSGTTTYQTADSGTCSTSAIPNLPGKRIWYYEEAVDSNANYDIQPEPSVGIYTYDQDDRFDIVQYVGRFNNRYNWGGNGKDVDIWYYITDSAGNPVTGATVYVMVSDTAGSTSEGPSAMTDCSTTSCTSPTEKPTASPGDGWYYYAATGTYTNLNVDVYVKVAKSQFTTAQCGETNIAKNLSTWRTLTCN